MPLQLSVERSFALSGGQCRIANALVPRDFRKSSEAFALIGESEMRRPPPSATMQS